MLIDPADLAVTTETPLDQLIAAEEHEHAEMLDLGGVASIPPDALRLLVLFLLPQTSNPTSSSYWRIATRRLCALAYSIGVEEVRRHPLAKLGPAAGCTRALLSLLACELRDFADLDHRAGRSDQARQTYSARARAVWNTRGRSKREAEA
jgi:hypothetical protein